MKILQVLCGGAWGGGSVVVLAVVRALIERGDQVWVVALDDVTASRFAAAGARIVSLNCWRRSINPLDVIPFIELYRLCRRERFDLVVTHTSKGGFLGRIAARLAGTPRVIHHAHGFAFRECQRPVVRRLYIALEKFAARFSDFILCVSEEHRQGGLAAGVAPPERVRTVLNGIDWEPFSRAEDYGVRRALGLPASDLLIGVGSRLAPKKGVEYLIRAMPAVVAAFPNARLLLFGDGPIEAELKQEARNSGCADRIHFAGFHSNMAEKLAALDVVVQPSLSEGLSISVLEAMAAGKPLVVCDIQGNREIVRHGFNGLVAPPADPGALAHSVCTLLADPDLAARLGAAARRTVIERFSQDRMIQETLAIYDRWTTAPQETTQLCQQHN